jgi:hypothetical protein
MLHHDHEANPTRRQWLTAAARWLMLSGLALVATVLGLRRGRASAGAAACPSETSCGRCGLNSRCALEPAMVWRQTGLGLRKE